MAKSINHQNTLKKCQSSVVRKTVPKNLKKPQIPPIFYIEKKTPRVYV